MASTITASFSSVMRTRGSNDVLHRAISTCPAIITQRAPLTSSKRLVMVRASVEEETDVAVDSPDQPVSVRVSRSDLITMFFQAEGTMNETAIPNVTKAVEENDGISNLRVRVLEGIATVELEKKTTVQATGVAASLLEAIQGSGFKLQTLNLSFEDEDEVAN